MKRRFGLKLLAATLFSATLLAAKSHGAPVDLVGINLSGAGFASHILPGVNGRNYIFPTESYFSQWNARGVKLVRFPIIWERLQPQLGAPLDKDYAQLIDQTFNFAQKYGIKIILDLHNYMRYRGTIIGTGAVSFDHYRDVLTRISQRWSSSSALYAYDIMNEPHDAMEQWPIAAQAGIDGIRTIDSFRPIMIEGNGWAEATRWAQWNDSLLKLRDPANNLIFQAHAYFDGDGGGGTYTNTNVSTLDVNHGVARVRPFVEWLKKNGKRGMIGEFGIPDDNPRWGVIMGNMLAYLKQNCIPATYWAAGPGWANYNLAIEPINGIERPQWSVLKNYIDDTSCAAVGPLPTSAGNIVIPTEASAPQQAVPNRPDSVTEAVQGFYTTYLNRSADAEGLRFYLQKMAAGDMTLASVETAISHSPERVAAINSKIKDLYAQQLERDADTEGLDYYTRKILNKSASYAEIAQSMRASYEFLLRQSIKDLYTQVLGRNADTEGLKFYMQNIALGKMSLESTRYAMMHSQEYRWKVADQVSALYRKNLNRDADGEGMEYYTKGLIEGSMTLNSVNIAMKNSLEYKIKHLFD